MPWWEVALVALGGAADVVAIGTCLWLITYLVRKGRL